MALFTIVRRSLPGAVVIGLLVLFGGPVFGPDRLQAAAAPRFASGADRIDQAYRKGALTYAQALNFKVDAVFHPKDLPPEFQPLGPLKSGTPILREALSHRELLSPKNRGALLRPTDSGDRDYYYGDGVVLCSYVSSGGHFRIHYTTDNRNGDAVSTTDLNRDGVPDYVEKLARFLEEAWTREIQQMGFDAPPADGITGGDCLLDVYLKNLNAYGLTVYDATPSDVYMILENDYQEGFPPNLDPQGMQEGDMKVTAAHEFFHTIQWQVAQCPPNCWWMEASATWMEDAVYPEVKDYLNYLNLWFQRPDLPLDTYNGWFEYGTAVWVKHLSEKYGEGIIREIWLSIDDNTDALAAIRNVLADPAKASTLEDEMREFRAKNGALVYWNTPYVDGAYYPGSLDLIYGNDTAEDYSQPFQRSFQGNCILSPSSCVSPLSAIYYLFSAPTGQTGALDISFQGVSGQADILVIGMSNTFPVAVSSGDTYTVSDLELDGSRSGSLQVGSFGAASLLKQVMVILSNPGESPMQGTLTVSFREGADPAAPATITLKPAGAAVVSGGRLQLSAQMLDGSGAQVLESGIAWSPAQGAVQADANGLITVAADIQNPAPTPVTADFAGVTSTVPSVVTPFLPLVPSSGIDRACNQSQWVADACGGILGRLGGASSGGGDRRCFIATAAYGTSLHPHVRLLREFRDRYLVPHAAGRAFVEWYYRNSPPVAQKIAGDGALKSLVAAALLPAVFFAAFMVKTSLLEKTVFFLVIWLGIRIQQRRLHADDRHQEE